MRSLFGEKHRKQNLQKPGLDRRKGKWNLRKKSNSTLNGLKCYERGTPDISGVLFLAEGRLRMEKRKYNNRIYSPTHKMGFKILSDTQLKISA